MDWDTDVKLLGMKKTRLGAMRQLREQAVERRRGINHSERPQAALREDLNINRLTAEINRLNDEIFVMGRKLGVNPKGGFAELDSTKPVPQSGTADSSN